MHLMSDWQTVLLSAGAALVGALIGATASLYAAWIAWKREMATRWDHDRRETYARFMGAVEDALGNLGMMWVSINADPETESGHMTVHHYTIAMNAISSARGLRHEVLLLGSEPVRTATANLLQTIPRSFPKLDESRVGDESAVDDMTASMKAKTSATFKLERRNQQAAVDGFRAACQIELGIP